MKTDRFVPLRMFGFLALAALMLGASNARAGSVVLASDISKSESQLGQYLGSLTYTATDATNALLRIELTNTTPTASGGYITGFVFNNPNHAMQSMVDFKTSDSDYEAAFDNDDLRLAPFGDFDFHVSLKRGGPQNGLGTGQSGWFEFSLKGNGLNTLTADSFLTSLSTGTGAGQGYQPFVVRFQGFANGGSDKVPVLIVPSGGGDPDDGGPDPDPNPDPNAVPEPSSLAMVAIGLASGAFVYRRRRLARR